ncbi:MAG: hypothetical protein KUG79_18105 [Pseudomonadales bacterium]|nr:hypothetical protein [Pseudomonadales bacterium]
MKKALILLAVFCSIVACTAPQRAYVGMTENELIRQLGQPIRIAKGKNGDRILIYKRLYLQEQDIGGPQSSGGGRYNTLIDKPLDGEVREKGYFIDPEGLVYKISWGK